MYVWEMIACRLRDEGWSVWHAATRDEDYTVHFHRPGLTGEASGPTLTDAYAEVARRARAVSRVPMRAATGPHFAVMSSAR
jgi:hypothetical protein